MEIINCSSAVLDYRPKSWRNRADALNFQTHTMDSLKGLINISIPKNLNFLAIFWCVRIYGLNLDLQKNIPLDQWTKMELPLKIFVY